MCFSRRLFSFLRGPTGFGVVAGTLMVIGTSLLCIYLAASTPRAADLPVRNLTGGARAVHINGFDLWYREVGPMNLGINPAQTLVVIHGGPGMSDHYFGRTLDSLSDRYRVVYYDQRGSGFSQIRPEAGFYRFQYLTDELEALRKRVIRTDRIVLLGHSYGGLVAMKYALDHPSHVAGLILVSSMPPRDYRRLEPDDPRFADRLLHEEPTIADRLLLSSYQRGVIETLFDPTNDTQPDVGYMSYVPGRLLWDSSIGYDYTKGLQNLSTPALIIYGARDSFVEVVPKMLGAALRDSTLVEFSMSGHWAFLEEPTRFLRVVGTFLAHLPQR